RHGSTRRIKRDCATGRLAGIGRCEVDHGVGVCGGWWNEHDLTWHAPRSSVSMEPITWADFERVELRAGTIVAVEDFPEARKPAYKIKVDFGPELGVRQSSAQVTTLYTKEELVGRQILGVVNFPPKQIGPFVSEFLVAGFYREDGAVVLAVPDSVVPNGARLA